MPVFDYSASAIPIRDDLPAAHRRAWERAADGTGIPLDEPLAFVTAGLRADLGIDRYASAVHTRPSGSLRRMLGRALAPFAARMLARFRPPG